jgi:hypothetical protein
VPTALDAATAPKRAALPALFDGASVVTTSPHRSHALKAPAGSGSTPDFFCEGQTPAAPAKNSENPKFNLLCA